mmetsp:Transcript_6130/g.17305  ORF Transcript_6130/g.17305 Transcript_6130/m.17305 type:complete len:227 (+) Transcript_6130:885-1565(+)
MISGRFSAAGAEKKWLSISCAPFRNLSIMGKPYWSESGSAPTALQQEKRPPTQSQKPNTFFESMPKAEVLSSAVEHAATCFATQAGSPSSLMSHSFTVLAFNMVSAVVKVLETTSTSVVSALSPSSARLTSIGSTLARKRRRRPVAAAAASGSVFRASKTKSTPRYDPPIPMHKTSVSGLPVKPFHSPERTFSEKSLMPSSTFQTSVTTLAPSTSILASRGARSAT